MLLIWRSTSAESFATNLADPITDATWETVQVGEGTVEVGESQLLNGEMIDPITVTNTNDEQWSYKRFYIDESVIAPGQEVIFQVWLKGAFVGYDSIALVEGYHFSQSPIGHQTVPATFTGFISPEGWKLYEARLNPIEYTLIQAVFGRSYGGIGSSSYAEPRIFLGESEFIGENLLPPITSDGDDSWIKLQVDPTSSMEVISEAFGGGVSQSRAIIHVSNGQWSFFKYVIDRSEVLTNQTMVYSIWLKDVFPGDAAVALYEGDFNVLSIDAEQTVVATPTEDTASGGWVRYEAEMTVRFQRDISVVFGAELSNIGTFYYTKPSLYLKELTEDYDPCGDDPDCVDGIGLIAPGLIGDNLLPAVSSPGWNFLIDYGKSSASTPAGTITLVERDFNGTLIPAFQVVNPTTDNWTYITYQLEEGLIAPGTELIFLVWAAAESGECDSGLIEGFLWGSEADPTGHQWIKGSEVPLAPVGDWKPYLMKMTTIESTEIQVVMGMPWNDPGTCYFTFPQLVTHTYDRSEQLHPNAKLKQVEFDSNANQLVIHPGNWLGFENYGDGNGNGYGPCREATNPFKVGRRTAGIQYALVHEMALEALVSNIEVDVASDATTPACNQINRLWFHY